MRLALFCSALIWTTACASEEAAPAEKDKEPPPPDHEMVPDAAVDNSDAMANEGPGDPPDMEAFTTERCGDQALTEDWVIAAGESAKVCAGSVFTAAANVRILVEGQLHVLGSAESKVIFKGEEGALGFWGGIVIAGGGYADIDHATFSDATRALEAQVDSDYVMDHSEVSNSTDFVLLASSGLVDHSVFHGNGGAQQNQGPFMIEDASPLVRNSSFDNSNGFTDMIRVFGTSSAPEFNHLHVKDAHCAFHIQQGTGVKILNSIIENLAYGVMAITSVGTQIEGNVFINNAIHVGLCYGGESNAPKIDNNFYEGDEPSIDRSCESVGVVPNTIMDAAPEGAGPEI